MSLPMSVLFKNKQKGRLSSAVVVSAFVCICSQAVGADLDDALRRDEMIRRSLAALPERIRKRLDEGGADKVPVLLEILGDPKTPASVVRRVVEALGHLRDRRSVEALGAVLEARFSAGVTRGAVWALGQVKDRKALEYLMPLLDEEKLVLRRPAATAIASLLRDPGIEDPAGLLAGEILLLGPAGQIEVLRIIDRFDPPEDTLQALLGALSSGSLPAEVARECMKLIGGARYVGIGGAYEGLREALGDEDPLVRGEAAVVLARMPLEEEQRESILPELLEQLSLEDETGKGRALALRALARVTSGSEGHNSYDWRVWGVKEGYGDPARPLPPEDYTPPVPTVTPRAAPPPPPRNPLYMFLGAGITVLAVGLLIVRPALVRRSAATISRRGKPRGRERRVHARMTAEVPVRYRYLSHDRSFTPSKIFKGTTLDVSAGGIQIAATVPDPDWVQRLRDHDLFVGVDLDIPGEDRPVRTYMQVKWVRGVEGEKGQFRLGLTFKEITKLDQDRVQRFVLDLGMT